MKKIFLNLIFIIAPIMSFAQIAFDTHGDALFLRRPVNDEKARYEGISGNAFIIKDWTLGKVFTSKGESKEEVQLIYDQVESLLLTKQGNQLLSYGEDVYAFTLKDLTTGSYRKFSRGYAATKETDKSTFFEEISAGKLTLLKHSKKRISSTRNYDGTESKSIDEVTRYYLATSKTDPLVPTKLDKNEFLAAMADKKQQVNDYINQEKLNVKKVADAAKLVDYYNTL